jgi:hypothetical protein
MDTHYLNGKKGRNLYLKTTRLWAFSEDRSPVTRIGNRGVIPNYKAETLHQSTLWAFSRWNQQERDAISSLRET